MLNPDGVFNGNFRMDVSNFNLNRYYQQPEKKKQPACYALLNLLKKQKKIVMFIDIHAHSQAKPAFVYGNALEDFVSMVETQLFPKLISLNTQHFDFEHCNFSEKQMAAIDRFECRSKEGSARVQAFKQFGIIHSYTLECGFHQMWAVPLKSKYCSSFPSASKLLEIYSEIGSGLLISILDLFALNPYSRIPTTSIQIIRKEISKSISKLQRFKITDRMTLMKKNQNINELAQELYQENKIMVPYLFFQILFILLRIQLIMRTLKFIKRIVKSNIVIRSRNQQIKSDYAHRALKFKIPNVTKLPNY